MACGLQRVFLTALLAASPGYAQTADPADDQRVQVIEPDVHPERVRESKIDTENFELGVFAGILTIDNFGTSPLVGARLAFHATEDFFIQLNYGAANAGTTSFEELIGNDIQILTDSEREYRYYDALLGYNVLPGEFFVTRNRAFNGAIYILGGVGNTSFAGEDNFTFTLGTGYRVILKDWLTVGMDFRDHMFSSDLINESETTHNIELSLSLSFFF